MRLALYVRVSTDRQVEEGVSLDGQICQLKAWADREGHLIIETYQEQGASATDDRRPQFQKMIADAVCPDHPYDAIAVFSLSRFFRDAYALADYERRLRRAHVRLISITQQTGDDESGQLVRGILTYFDEYQSKENGKNVRRSMVENAKQGFFNGARPPFGYTAAKTEIRGRSGLKRRLEPHADEAEIVRLIFKWANQGDCGTPWGVKKIATNLNERGSLKRGKKWGQQQVWNILSSTTYYGDYIFNRRDSRNKENRNEREWVTTKVPPIISKEEFENTAAGRSERAPAGKLYAHRAASSPALLTGIARCAHCSSGFVLMSGKGGQYDYYRCSTKSYKGAKLCDCPNIPREELEAVVLTVIAERVLQPERIFKMLEQLREAMIKIQTPDRDLERSIHRQMALATEQINSWYQLVEEGKASLHDTLKERLGAAQRRIDHMAKELSDIARRRHLPIRKFGEPQVHAFAAAVRSEVLSPGSKYAKGYLRAIISEVKISAAGGRVLGSYVDMAEAVSAWRPGTTAAIVPRHVSNWRGGQESNL